MTNRVRCVCVKLLVALVMLTIVRVSPPHAQAQTFDKPTWLNQINHVRLQNGAAPVAYSTILESAAQRHTDDMAAHHKVDAIGSDGSDTAQRAADAGYGAWGTRRLVAENLVVSAQFVDALDVAISEPEQLRVLLSPRVREVGLGATQVGGQLYISMLFGAQPNVLPIFVNDGSASTKEVAVAVRLLQEDVVPISDANFNAIGKVVDVRLSTRADFSGVDWQSFERLIPFSLENTPGNQTIYAQYRDATGRIANSKVNITYDPNAQPPVPEGLGARVTDLTIADRIATGEIDSATLLAPGRVITDVGTPIPVAVVRTVLARTPAARAVVAGTTPTGIAIATATPLFVEATVAQESPPATAVVLPPASSGMIASTPMPGSRSDNSLAALALPWIFALQAAIAMIGLALFLRIKRQPH